MLKVSPKLNGLTKFILSQSLCGSEIWSCPSKVQEGGGGGVSPKVLSGCWPGLRLAKSWKVHSQDGSLHGCWREASALHWMSLSSELLECLLSMAATVPRVRDPRESEREPQRLLHLHLECHATTLCRILFIRKQSLSSHEQRGELYFSKYQSL